MSRCRFVVKLLHFEQKAWLTLISLDPLATSRPQDALLEAMNAKIGGMKAVVFHQPGEQFRAAYLKSLVK